MIDPNEETLVSLVNAASSLPARRGGKKPHVSCLYRWTKTGCKGVVLESLQCGGTRVTSREALARFFGALTRANSPSPSAPCRQSAQAGAQAERELDAAGI